MHLKNELIFFSALSRVRARSKCLVLPMEPEWESEKMQHEGRYHNYEIILIPHQNISGQIVWKKSYEQKFFYYTHSKMTDTSETLEISYSALPPWYIPSTDGKIVGIDVTLWKIIGSHLKLNIRFLKAINMGRTIDMVTYNTSFSLI